MFIEEIPLDHQSVLNYCSKINLRISFEDNPGNNASSNNFISPIIDAYYPDKNNFNQVTFIYVNKIANNDDIYLIGDFDVLNIRYTLNQVFFNKTETIFHAITLKIPSKKLCNYKFLKNGYFINDPLNPLTRKLDNGNTWSLFFTKDYKTPIIFENWEVKILQRLVSYILPFKTDEFKTFVKNHNSSFDNITKSLLSQTYYDIGVVNFIDKLIARHERHHIISYKICLKEIKRILHSLNNSQEAADMDEYFYDLIYQIMKTNDLSQWDADKYNEPSYFLKILRRHIITAAFSHPKYGGNSHALGWQFLEKLLSNEPDTETHFDWRKSLEKPLGRSDNYIA